MRAVEFLRKKFEFCLQYKKPFYITSNEIAALNEIIQFINDNKINTEFEEALLLFYLKCNWELDNENARAVLREKPKEQINFPLNINSADIILGKICAQLQPKEMVKNMLHVELLAHQELNNIPKEQQITFEQTEELIEEVLLYAKTNFPSVKKLTDEKLRHLCRPIKMFK